MQVPLNLIVGLVVLLVAYGIHRWISAITSKADQLITEMKELRSSLASATAAVDHARITLTPASEEAHKNLMALPALLSAITRIGSAQLDLMKQQAANPFGRSNSMQQKLDVTGANMEHDISEIMRSDGVSREQAMLQLNPANQESVWGESIFNGWNGRQR